MVKREYGTLNISPPPATLNVAVDKGLHGFARPSTSTQYWYRTSKLSPVPDE